MSIEMIAGILLVMSVVLGLYLIHVGRSVIANRRVQIHDTDTYLEGPDAVRRGWMYVGGGVYLAGGGLVIIVLMLLR